MAKLNVPVFDDRNIFIAFSHFTGDRETFDSWYDDEHIPQVMDSPGMVGAQRFVPDDTKPLSGTVAEDWGHAAVYELEGGPSGFREEVKRLLMSGEMVLPDFMIQPFTAIFLEPVSPAQTSARFAEIDELTDRHLWLVFSKRPEDPAAYDKWYDEEHIRDIMSVPGMLRAQRYVTSSVKPLPGVVTPEMSHVAVYEAEGSFDSIRENIKQQLISGAMVLPDFMQPPIQTIFGSMFLKPVSSFYPAAGARAKAAADGN